MRTSLIRSSVAIPPVVSTESVSTGPDRVASRMCPGAGGKGRSDRNAERVVEYSPCARTAAPTPPSAGVQHQAGQQDAAVDRRMDRTDRLTCRQADGVASRHATQTEVTHPQRRQTFTRISSRAGSFSRIEALVCSSRPADCETECPGEECSGIMTHRNRR